MQRPACSPQPARRSGEPDARAVVQGDPRIEERPLRLARHRAAVARGKRARIERPHEIERRHRDEPVGRSIEIAGLPRIHHDVERARRGELRGRALGHRIAPEPDHRIGQGAVRLPKRRVVGVDDLRGVDGPFDELGRSIGRTIRRNTGIPVSIGIAPTKTLAKIASKLAKQYPRLEGCCYMHRAEDIDKVLGCFPLRDVWGIGRRYGRMFDRTSERIPVRLL